MTPINNILTVEKTPLAAIDLKGGYENSWSFQNKCYNGEPISVNFSGTVAKGKLWSIFEIYLDIDFLVNGQVVYNYKGNKSGTHEITFQERIYHGKLGTKDIKFTVRVNKCVLKTLGEETTTSEVPLENAKLALKLNLNY